MYRFSLHTIQLIMQCICLFYIYTSSNAATESDFGLGVTACNCHLIFLLPQFHESLAPFYTYVKYVWMICSDRMISRVHARILTIASDPPCLRTYLLYPCQAIDQTTQSIFFQLTCGIIIFDEVAWVLLVHMQVGNEKS